MTITKEQNGSELIVKVEGRLDTNTAPTIEEELKDSFDVIDSLVFDLEQLEYISSAGLRVLLTTHKKLAAKGGMKLINVGSDVMEVLEVTGFSDILTIE